MNDISAGIPNILIEKIVIIFIGIIILKDDAIKLYPYNKNTLNIIFFKKEKTFFNMLSTSV